MQHCKKRQAGIGGEGGVWYLGFGADLSAQGSPVTTLMLRGLPFKAQVSDIVRFFQGFGVAAEDAALVVREGEGRPSGEATVRFGSQEVAKAAQQKLHKKTMEWLSTRYIEVLSDHPILPKIEAACSAQFSSSPASISAPASAPATATPTTTTLLTGIGATIVSSSSGGCEITSLTSTGSARLHLQVGDRITSIGSVATSGKTDAQVKALIIGPAGSTISMVSARRLQPRFRH